jgi:dTDP-glucose pyrophosphorylase
MKANDLLEYCLQPNDPMLDAIERLNRNTTKLVLVTSAAGQLLGSVTDGDIRRALLKHEGTNTPIKDIMNTSPKSLHILEDPNNYFNITSKYGIPAIPQVDDLGRVVNILGSELAEKKKNNPVFLMAGGFGTRLRPLTDDCPKPMLKVGNKPILENILEQFIQSGFHDFYISTHYLNEQIENYFGNGNKFGVSIKYINEDTPLGTAGAISLLPEATKDKHIIMMNGDLLTKINFDDMLDFHLSEEADITVAVKDHHIQVPYGVIEHTKGLITDIKEKPIEHYFINAGVYCISPGILKSVVSKKFLDMPTLIDGQVQSDGHVSMFPIHEYWLDIGQMNDYEQAQTDVLKLSSIA